MRLIPEPKEKKRTEGIFCITEKTGISMERLEDFTAGEQIKNAIFEELRLTVPFSTGLTTRYPIFLQHTDREGEGYHLSITPDSVTVTGNRRGIFYGVQTFVQLLKQYHNRIPCVEIEDEPDFPNRGFYHDVARGKIPKMETLKRLVDQLALFKFNQLQLYVEHTFAFPFMTESWSGKDALQPADILELDRYCKERCIELVPSIATFGHMHDILLTESFKYLNELEDAKEELYFWTDRAMHHTIDISNPESFELVKKMIDDFLPLFSSNKFNLCGDETEDLGMGKNRERSEKEGVGTLYAEFMKKLMNHIKSYGKTVMFWADIIKNHPDKIEEIAGDDVVALSWGYAPNVPDTCSKILSEAGMRHYVCSSTHASRTIVCNYPKAYANTKRQVSHGVKYHAEGVLITNWGNMGVFGSIACSMPIAAYGAECCWNSSCDAKIETLEETYSNIMFGGGNVPGALRRSMETITMDWGRLVFWTYNHCGYFDQKLRDYIMYEDHYRQGVLEPTEEEIHRGYCQTVEAADEVLSLIPVAREKDDLHELYTLIRGTSLLYSFQLIVKKYFANQSVKDTIFTPQQLAVEIELWFEEFRRNWYRINYQSEIFRNTDFIHTLTKILRSIKAES